MTLQCITRYYSYYYVYIMNIFFYLCNNNFFFFLELRFSLGLHMCNFKMHHTLFKYFSVIIRDESLFDLVYLYIFTRIGFLTFK